MQSTEDRRDATLTTYRFVATALTAGFIAAACGSPAPRPLAPLQVGNPSVEQHGWWARPSWTASAISVPGDTLFAIDSAALTATGRATVAAIARDLADHEVITVAGHTDATGTVDHNERLAEQRAVAVMQLLRTLGVPGSHLSAVGCGARFPAADEHTDSGRMRNRRVVLVLAPKPLSAATACSQHAL